jgi:Holliday junction DNA helicase RuvA
MFSYLKGKIDSISAESCIIEVSDIGYLVFASKKTLITLNEGDVCKLYVEPLFRQEMLFLYGFSSQEEREWFKILLNVQGVGARVALNVLSILSVNDLIQAILNQDKTMLGRADGVGPKLAGRLLLELKDKVKGLSLTNESRCDVGEQSNSSAMTDALSALVNLGYTRFEALQALKHVANDTSKTSADLIRESLRQMQIKKAF